MTHKTKGIVLRTVKYGETSVITTVYTELFGIRSYIVKGIRQQGKRGEGKANYFQPAAILEMVVYHNELKNLQFIKEFEWSFLYQHVLFNVVKNAVAMYVVELLQHSLKQPEPNPKLFYHIEDTLKQLDKGANTFAANLPLYFTLHLGRELGFQIQGEYSKLTPVLDLQEGQFTTEIPTHSYYINGEHASITSKINSINFYSDLTQIELNKTTRRELLQGYQHYVGLHIESFKEMKSLRVLREVLS